MDLTKVFNTNRETWNKKVSVHAASDFYDLDSFKKGASSLTKFELVALGDVSGKSLLHLQCHFGQDTLSWQRLGAQCTGIDISEEGIKLAQNLNSELGLDAKFVCCNVLDTSANVSETFDIVFTSYGTVSWLPDLEPWGQMINERLNPGGIFYIVDFHPIPWMYDYGVSPPELKFGYRQTEVIYEEYEGTYGDKSSKMLSKEYGWNHGLGVIVSALAKAGLQIEYLEEHQDTPYDIFPGLVETNDGLYKLPNGLYPLTYELKAVKK